MLARHIRSRSNTQSWVVRYIALLIVTGTAVLAPVSIRSATASVGSASKPATQHCVILVGKAASPGGISPVLYHYCSTVSSEDARTHMITSRTAIGPFALSADLLMTWFEHSDFFGASTQVFGDDGTCDSAGYRLDPNPTWANNISSAKGFGQCNHARFTNIAQNFSDDFALPIDFIGQTLNDNVGTIHVFHD